MRFAEPSWLWAGAASLVGLCLLVLWSERRRARALARFVAGRQLSGLASSASAPRRWLAYALRVLSAACFFVALARPQWGYHFEAEKREGVDVLFAVDSSKSMLAQDLRPSRLARAKLAVEELAEKLAGARLGLLAFAGDAFLQTPLTADRVAFQQSLDALDTTAIPIAGTNLQSAIRVAKQAFASEPEQRKILVLLTDGEDLSNSVAQAARDAADSGIVVHAIGVGTSAGAAIPVADGTSGDALLRDPNGQLVHTHLDEAALRELSTATGGSYHALQASGQGALQLYRDALSRLPKQLHDVNMRKVFEERFQWPLGLGMALLLLSVLIQERRPHGRASARTIAAVSFALLCAPIAVSSGAAAQDRSQVETYNDATGRYRSGDFNAAAEGYRGALATSDLALQQRAYYDLGNSLYRQGQASEPKAVPQAMERYKEAIAAYESALALDDHDEDARYNRDFVRAKLQQLEKQASQQANSGNKREQDASARGSANKGQANGQRDQAQAGGGGESDQEQQPGAGGRSKPAPAEQGSNEGQPNKPGGHSATAAADPRTGQPRAADPAASGGSHGEAKDGDPRAGQASEKATTEGSASAGDPSQAETSRVAPDAAGQQLMAAGALTSEQAARLLDALEGELRQLPSGEVVRRPRTQQHEQARKDW